MDCGPSDGLSLLSKQVFQEGTYKDSNQSSSRIRPTQEEYKDEFFASQPDHFGFQHNPDIIPPLMLLQRPISSIQEDWRGEFHIRKESVAEEGLASNIHQQIRNPNQWYQNFSQMRLERNPTSSIQFDEAFNRVKEVEQRHEKGDWANEFEKHQESTFTNNDTLSKTAGALADIVSSSDNIKFKNSKFLEMLEQLRTKEMAIEGDKLVMQIPATLSSHQMAQEFMAGKISTSGWEEEMHFNMNNQDLANAPPRNWQDQNAPRTWSEDSMGNNMNDFNTQRGDVSHDMDWTGEFRSRLGLVDLDNPIEEAREDPISYYAFRPNNPFVALSPASLITPEFHHNLTESILAYEALVQIEPRNARAWYDLGIKQQENENEIAAIAALRQSIELDSSHYDAYLSIAVSYTNENQTIQAQSALQDWLQKNPKYKRSRIASDNATSSEVHEMLIEEYLKANLSNQDVDADVQSALGVLFNISNEFGKAIDCFQTALSARPRDFQLWNKLGATLANSGESEKAMEAYFNALQINPSYIRARYNLAIACIQIGQYQVHL